MTEELRQCAATPSWTISVPAHFRETRNPDSWQASDGQTRTIYVSAMKVEGAEAIPLENVCAFASQSLAPPHEAERHRLELPGLVGEAHLKSVEVGFEFRGLVCAPGSIVTCLINFSSEQFRQWSLATWQSLRFEAPKKRGWRPW
jgi:hypothetical protein